jgi:chromosome partitioning protein
MITVFCSRKGGTGKSTGALSLALMLKNVAVIDADPQQSLSYLSSIAEQPFALESAPGPGVSSAIRRLERKYKHVIVDTAGADSATVRAALAVADRVLVPCDTSALCLATLPALAAIIEDARRKNSRLVAYAYINNCNPRAVKEVEMARDYISSIATFEMMDAKICSRSSIRKSLLDGTTLGRDEKSRSEIKSWTKELQNEV